MPQAATALRDRLVADGVPRTTADHLASLDPAERADAEQLAQARQHIATPGCPSWVELTADERAAMIVSALHWLRAARAAGLASDIATAR